MNKHRRAQEIQKRLITRSAGVAGSRFPDVFDQIPVAPKCSQGHGAVQTHAVPTNAVETAVEFNPAASPQLLDGHLSFEGRVSHDAIDSLLRKRCRSHGLLTEFSLLCKCRRISGLAQ